MICENFVDKQWKRTAERKAKEEESFRKREARAKEEVKRMEKVELDDDMVDEVFQSMCNDVDADEDYIPTATEEEVEEEGEKENSPPKRRRLVKSMENSVSDIPEHFRHIRNSIRKVCHQR